MTFFLQFVARSRKCATVVCTRRVCQQVNRNGVAFENLRVGNELNLTENYSEGNSDDKRRRSSSSTGKVKPMLLIPAGGVFLSLFNWGEKEEEPIPELVMSIKRSIYLIQVLSHCHFSVASLLALCFVHSMCFF